MKLCLWITELNRRCCSFLSSQAPTRVNCEPIPNSEERFTTKQGSAIGPASFVVIAADLNPSTAGNLLAKYADVARTLLCRWLDYDSRAHKLDNIETWAKANNLASTQPLQTRWNCDHRREEEAACLSATIITRHYCIYHQDTWRYYLEQIVCQRPRHQSRHCNALTWINVMSPCNLSRGQS